LANTTGQEKVVVEDVVAALTGPAEGAQRGDVRVQMERAARDFDQHAAESFCNALLELLAGDPSSVRGLEALVILGLAHPSLLEKHRIPLAQEGRRLAVLLERGGEVERAQSLLEVLSSQCPTDRGVERELSGIMRRSGSLDRLVERHLRRAEDAIRQGRREEAVHWLREVLVLDRSRRDVARMIRDLRYEDTDRRNRWKRRLQIAGLVTVLGAAAFGVVLREQRIEAEYAKLPHGESKDVAALRAQLQLLDGWIAKNPLWLGMFDAGRERSRLRTGIEQIEAAEHEAQRAALAAHAKQEIAAEAERVLGRRAAEHNDFAGAHEHFARALEIAPADWAARGQVQTDVTAIAAWIERNPVTPQEQKQ
jgi:tetratricopeptide (TPR) repeat protein